jgi:hypothetical protein
MPRSEAQYRISIRDIAAGKTLKVELIDARGLWGERRYRLRVDGREPSKIKEATLTEIFDRLRRWLVKRGSR